MDKLKITRRELEDMYEVIDETEESRKVINEINEDNGNATVTYEEFTEIKDKEDMKKWRSEDL